MAARWISSRAPERRLSRMCSKRASCWLALDRRLRDFGDQLVGNGPAERVEILRHHDKSARTANHVLTVIIRKSAGRIRMPGGQSRVSEYDQPVDGHALGNGLVASATDVTATIVVAISGNVDRAPS
jgi:hypothetical protein